MLSEEQISKIYAIYKKELDKLDYKDLSDKEYFKKLFKEYDYFLLCHTEEEMFDISNTYKIDVLEKVILFLRFKKLDNYKEKIKIIKQIDVSYDDLIIYEHKIQGLFTSVNVTRIREFENIINKYNLKREEVVKIFNQQIKIDILSKEKQKEIEQLNIEYKHYCLYLNTIKLIKCVLFNYHKKELVSYSNGKPKFKFVKNKSFIMDNGFLYFTDINMLYEKNAFIHFLNYLDDIAINKFSIANFINEYQKGSYIEDEYNKLLLDNNYLADISNRSDFNDVSDYLIGNSSPFRKRKILIPNSGVILLVQDNDLIESIYLKEKILNNTNNLIIITRYKNGTECVNSIMLDLDFNIPERMYYIGNKDLLRDNKNFVSYVFDFFEIDKNNPMNLKYEVIAPTYWKYRKNGYVASGDKLNDKGLVIKREYQIDIAPFLRKVNNEASDEAKKLAISLGLELEKGYTVVKPHTRVYNKVK